MVLPDFQPIRVSEEPVCIYIFRQNPIFTSLHLKSPVHVVPPLTKRGEQVLTDGVGEFGLKLVHLVLEGPHLPAQHTVSSSITPQRKVRDHRVGKVLSFFSSHRNWDFPNPSPAGTGALSLARGDIRTLWYSLHIRTLW